jgi:spore coat polysaccharide biosynthesis protein SpsF
VKVVVVVQARTGSSRLPNKVLLPLGGRPVLARMLERVEAAHLIDEVVVATTRLEADEPVRAVARAAGVPCVSGDPLDLLDRHVEAARASSADVVVKIPSDCPLIDPRVIDAVVGFFRRHGGRHDLVTNLLPPTWPDGNDVEVMRRDVLELAWREADRPFQREHTTPFIWDQPERFRIANVAAGSWNRPELPATHRLTLDYAEDHALIRSVFEALHEEGAAPFSAEDIVSYLDAHPEVRALNARWGGSSWMDKHRDELRTLASPTRAADTVVDTFVDTFVEGR